MPRQSKLTDEVPRPELTLQGSWWLPGLESDAVKGRFKLWGDHRGTLELFGRFAEPPRLDELVILGETDDGERVTLRGAWWSSSDLIDPPMHGHTPYVVFQTYLGQWLPEQGDLSFEDVTVGLSGLVDWLRAGDFLTAEWSADESTVTVYAKNGEIRDCVAEVDNFKVELRSKGVWQSTFGFREEAFAQVASLRVRAEGRRNLDDFLQVVDDVRNFMWLLRAAPANFEYLQGSREDLRRTLGSRDVVWPVRMFLHGLTNAKSDWDKYERAYFTGPELTDGFGDMFDRWTRLRRATPSVYSLFALPMYGVAGSHDMRFLNLVQALEGFSRFEVGGCYMSEEEWLSPGEGAYWALVNAIPPSVAPAHRDALKQRLKYQYQHSFRRMLQELVESTPVIQTRVIRCARVFARDVSVMRNQMVHVNEGQVVLLEEMPPIYDMVAYCELLLQAAILTRLGVDAERLARNFSGERATYRIQHLDHYIYPAYEHYRRTDG